MSTLEEDLESLRIALLCKGWISSLPPCESPLPPQAAGARETVVGSVITLDDPGLIVQTLQQQLCDKATRLCKAQLASDTADIELKACQYALTKARHEAGCSATQLKIVTKENSELREKLASASNQLQRRNSELEQLGRSCQQWKEQMDHLECSLARLQREHQHLEDRIVPAALHRISEQRAQLRRAQRTEYERDLLRVDVDALRHQLDDQEGATRQYMVEHHALCSAARESADQLRHSLHEWESKGVELEALRVALGEAHATIEVLSASRVTSAPGVSTVESRMPEPSTSGQFGGPEDEERLLAESVAAETEKWRAHALRLEVKVCDLAVSFEQQFRHAASVAEENARLRSRMAERCGEVVAEAVAPSYSDLVDLNVAMQAALQGSAANETALHAYLASMTEEVMRLMLWCADLEAHYALRHPVAEQLLSEPRQDGCTGDPMFCVGPSSGAIAATSVGASSAGLALHGPVPPARDTCTATQSCAAPSRGRKRSR